MASGFVGLDLYLCFTLLDTDRKSGRKRGVLVAAHQLRDADELSVDEHRLLQALQWFNQNLNVPPCLRAPENRRALSWFKSDAKTPLSRMWALGDQKGSRISGRTWTLGGAQLPTFSGWEHFKTWVTDSAEGGARPPVWSNEAHFTLTCATPRSTDRSHTMLNPQPEPPGRR